MKKITRQGVKLVIWFHVKKVVPSFNLLSRTSSQRQIVTGPDYAKCMTKQYTYQDMLKQRQVVEAPIYGIML